MILSDGEIWMEVNSGRLGFQPEIGEDQVGPSAVDLRLSNNFTTLRSLVAGTKTMVDLSEADAEEVARFYGDTVEVDEDETFHLEPGGLVLAYTLEYVTMPSYLAARVEGRSSLARLGVSIHQTAPTVHATFEGQLRLEMSNNGPFSCTLRPGQKICQLVIERLGSPSQRTLVSPWQRQRQ